MHTRRCLRCRKAKKKCIPEGRTWPQKCERCVKLHVSCSPPAFTHELASTDPEIIKPPNMPSNVRSAREIIQDIDCILYLLAGLKDYDYLEPTSIPLESAKFSNSYRYNAARTRNDLYENLRKFDHMHKKAYRELAAVYSELIIEAGRTIQYLNHRGRGYEVFALINILNASIKSYTAKEMIYELYEQKTIAQDPELGRIIRRNQKDRGQLFLYIKTQHLVINNINSNSTDSEDFPADIWDDLSEAQAKIQQIVERSKLPPLIEDSSNPKWQGYEMIDPLWFRYIPFMEKDDGAPIDAVCRTGLWQPDLDGKTPMFGIHELRDIFQSIAGWSETITTYVDVFGRGFFMQSLLNGEWQDFFSFWEKAGFPHRSCFIEGQELLEKFEETNLRFRIEENHFFHLDVHQIAALYGDLSLCQHLQKVSHDVGEEPHATYSSAANVEKAYASAKAYFEGIMTLDPEEFDPIVLAAFCNNFDIVKFMLIEKPWTFGVGQYANLATVTLILEKTGQQDILEPLLDSIRKPGGPHQSAFFEISTALAKIGETQTLMRWLQITSPVILMLSNSYRIQAWWDPNYALIWHNVVLHLSQRQQKLTIHEVEQLDIQLDKVQQFYRKEDYCPCALCCLFLKRVGNEAISHSLGNATDVLPHSLVEATDVQTISQSLGDADISLSLEDATLISQPSDQNQSTQLTYSYGLGWFRNNNNNNNASM
ncbi:hypothetical protein TWF694_000158 [Orbilia ellipsospora]|uniref:Zn(2)-C6 fungal-type domain-containing protein n=1 Tax=Orbilia ellipsospora TaxID=2528407 RepID=A0AAV9XPI6_9PEZI